MGSLIVDRISRYRLLRELGQTRLGHVYLSIATEDRAGAHLGADKSGKSRSPGFFCLELLNTSWAQDQDLRALFLDEAAQTLQLEHPNVVRTQEVIAEPTACGRVTRWFAGHSLAGLLERMGRAAFPLHLHVRVLCEILSALQYLHELDNPSGASADLVYRGASPERAFLTYTGQVKLLGVGFERTTDEIERRTGRLLTDIGYASPELCLGYAPSPGCDVYSVGVMLWEALARARRSFADTPEASLKLRISGEEPDVEHFRPGVPVRLAQICGRALAVSPRDRYASAQELQIDLESFLADTETDAQQNAGLGALAQLMMQHFAAERAEMLTWIEQQLASLEGPVEPGAVQGTAEAAARTAAVVAREGRPSAASAPAPASQPSSPPVSQPRRVSPALIEPPELPGSSLEGREAHTHAVTSLQEMLPVALAPELVPEQPAAAFASEQPASELVREPDTSGHRAYSSTLQQVPPRAGSLARFAVPVALAAGVLLLVTQGLRVAQRVPASSADPQGGALSSAPAQHVSEPRGGNSRELRALRPQAPQALKPAALPLTPELQPSAAQRVSTDAGVLGLPAFLEGAAPAAAAVSGAIAPGPVAAPSAVPASSPAPVEPGVEPSLPTLSADTLAPSVESRPAAKPRRAKPRAEARSEPRGARPSKLPRSIDETDPYLE